MKKDVLSFALLFSFIAQIILLFTPWFSFNIKVMGYYAGWYNFEFFLAQFIFAFYYFSKGKGRLWENILLELSVLSIPLALYHVAQVWVKSMNIAGRISFSDSITTSLPCYWVAVGVSFLSVLLCQLMLIAGKMERKSTRVS